MIYKHSVWQRNFVTNLDGFEEPIYVVFHPEILKHVSIEVIDGKYLFTIDTPVRYSATVENLFSLRKVLRDALEKYMVSSSESPEEQKKFSTYFHLVLITTKSEEETNKILKDNGHENPIVNVTKELKERIEQRQEAEKVVKEEAILNQQLHEKFGEK